MSRKTQRYVLRNKANSEYYTVFGWTPKTTDSLTMAVVFPNDLLGEPKDKENWERVEVDFSSGFARLPQPAFLGCLTGTINFGPGWDEPLPLEDWEALR